MNRWRKGSTLLVLGLSWSCAGGGGHHASQSAAAKGGAQDAGEPSVGDPPDASTEIAASDDAQVPVDEEDSAAESDDSEVGPDPDDPDALCRFDRCGGDLVGDWMVENICLGGVLGSCEVGYPDLGEGEMLHFGCAGDFHGTFGVQVSCVQMSCDCMATKSTRPEDATYIAFGTGVTFRPAGGSPVNLDYCVQGDVLTLGQPLSRSTPLGPIRQYAAITARRVSSTITQVCSISGAQSATPRPRRRRAAARAVRPRPPTRSQARAALARAAPAPWSPPRRARRAHPARG